MGKTATIASFVALIVVFAGVVVWLAFVNQSTSPTASKPANTNRTVTAEHALVAGFPTLPVFPAATIVESSKREVPLNTGSDLRAKWTSSAKVPAVAKWYLDNLPASGWQITERPDDPEVDEQIIRVNKGNLHGIIGIAWEDGHTEIVADFSDAGGAK
jgi:hypothetical protein